MAKYRYLLFAALLIVILAACGGNTSTNSVEPNTANGAESDSVEVVDSSANDPTAEPAPTDAPAATEEPASDEPVVEETAEEPVDEPEDEDEPEAEEEAVEETSDSDTPTTEFDPAGYNGNAGTNFVVLDNPEMIPANEATWLMPDEIVLGVEQNGEVHAYPVSQMVYHHIANTTIGGEPYLVTY